MPKYYNLVTVQLADRIENYIEVCGLLAGDKLPSERQLAVSFGVSRMTVRNAVRHLCNEGLLVQRHGSGTYLAAPRWQRNISEGSFETQLRLKKDERVNTSLLGIDRHKASTQIGWKMKWERDEPVYRIRMLHAWDEESESYEVIWIPERLCPGLEKQAVEKHSMLHVLEQKYSFKFDRIDLRIQIVKSNREQSRILGIEKGTLMTEEEKIVLDKENEPVYYSVNVAEWTKFVYRADLR